MGLYLNPGNEQLRQDLRSKIYIDKSMLISKLNELIGTSDKYVCVSRPRRFGKSMAGNMIAAYYSKGCDSRELFKDLKIAGDPSFESNLNNTNVIKIDLNAMYNKATDKSNLVKFFTGLVRDEFVETFPDVGIKDDDTMPLVLERVYAKKGEKFVVIIDEYDVLVRERADKELFEEYLRFLNGMFKNADLAPAIQLAYLTGILPIVRDKIQSKLNLFAEYSMLEPRNLAEFVGFTAEETEGLCKKYGMDYDECRRWYDGYSFDDIKEVFNPKSVVEAMTIRKFSSYWTQTGSFDALRLYILMNLNGIKDDVITMIGGGKVEVKTTKYLNTMTDFNSKDAVFTYLIHLGYLAYQAPDYRTEVAGKCYIPNREIREQWIECLEDEIGYKEIIEQVQASRQLIEETIACNEKAVAAALDKAHQRATNPLTYNNEASFQSAIGLAYFYANLKYTVIKELPTGKGYADLALIPYVPNIPALIIELKCSDSADSAINQIKNKEYDDLLQHYRGDMLFVGVSYNKKSKKHTCKIERIMYYV
ncbi:MAG: ATP-binding protein [Paludibacteraceae bacterium]|nr:ATP-binding protein [Paludibacteraceae bacterium]